MYFSFQIPKIYILLWLPTYVNLNALMFQQQFHTVFPEMLGQGQDHWLPKFFGEGNFVDLKLFLP